MEMHDDKLLKLKTRKKAEVRLLKTFD